MPKKELAPITIAKALEIAGNHLQYSLQERICAANVFLQLKQELTLAGKMLLLNWMKADTNAGVSHRLAIVLDKNNVRNPEVGVFYRAALIDPALRSVVLQHVQPA